MTTALNTTPDADDIMDTFYAEVCEGRGKEVKVSKKKAVAALVALGCAKDLATRRVQSSFEAIREQQRG